MKLRIRFIAALTLLHSVSLATIWSYQAAADDGVRKSSQQTSIHRKPSFVYYGTRDIRVEEHSFSVASNEHDEAVSPKLNPFVCYGTRELGFSKPEVNTHEPTSRAAGFDGDRPFVYYGTRSIKTPTN